jgi:hypothetical protein
LFPIFSKSLRKAAASRLFLMKNLIWQAYSLCNLYFWKYFSNFSSKTDCLATVFRKIFEKLENKQCTISFLPGSDQFVLCLVGDCTTNCFQIVKNTWTFPNFPKTDLARENPSPRSFFYTVENNQNTFVDFELRFRTGQSQCWNSAGKKKGGNFEKGKQGQCEFENVFCSVLMVVFECVGKTPRLPHISPVLYLFCTYHSTYTCRYCLLCSLFSINLTH